MQVRLSEIFRQPLHFVYAAKRFADKVIVILRQTLLKSLPDMSFQLKLDRKKLR